MAATSPYQNNDYQAVSSFRPYKLPVNDIFKALVAQNQFWEQGASRVKTVYDNALDLKLSLEPNKELRDNYMKEASKQLTKLSAMDLSDPSVQREGFSIFDNLFKDQGIVSDDQATRHIERVNSDALMSRDKDGGKGYSSVNHKYALIGADEFHNSTDRLAGIKYLKQRKEYEPFYDPSSELSSILKNCKPDKAVGNQVQGMYIHTMTDESLSAEKINSCLDGGLSDRARRQLQINGAVQYKDNPEALRDAYVPHLQGTRSSLSQQKAALEGALANVNNLKNLKPEPLRKFGFNSANEVTPDAIKAMRENVAILDNRIANIDGTIGKLRNNNFEPIQGENFEPVAGSMFSKDYMKNVGEGFSYDFTSNTRKADPIQMMYYKEHELNARQEDDQANDREMLQTKLDADLAMKMLEVKNKKKEEGELDFAKMTPDEINIARSMNTSDHPFSSLGTGSSYDDLTGRRSEIATQRAKLNKQFDKEIGNPHPSGSPEALAFRNAFIASGETDPVKKNIITDYQTTMDKYIATEDMYKNIQNNVDEKVRSISKDFEAKRVGLNGLGSLNVTLKDGSGKSMVLNKSLGDIASDVLAGKASINRHGFGGALDINYGNFSTTVNNDASNKRDLLIKVFDFVKEGQQQSSKINNRRNKLLRDETVIQREGYSFPELNKKFRETLATSIGLTEENFKNITVGQTDLNGNVIVSITPPKKGDNYTVEDVANKLLKYGSASNKLVPGTNNQVMLTGISELDVIHDTNFSHVLSPYIRSIENKATPDNPASTGYMRSGNGRQYKLEVLPKHDGGYRYRIIDQAAPSSPTDMFDDRQTALSIFQQRLQRNQPQVSTK